MTDTMIRTETRVCYSPYQTSQSTPLEPRRQTSVASHKSLYSSQSSSQLQTSRSICSSSFSNAKVKSFSVSLSSTVDLGDGHVVCMTGQTLTAHVKLDLRKSLKFLRLVFECICEEKTGMTIKKRKLLKTVLCPDHKKHLHTKLKAGEHNYTAYVDLPGDSLPSFECNSKYVRYYCKVTAIRVRSKNTLKAPVVNFEVLQDNPVTNNLLNEPQEPVEDAVDVGSVTAVCKLNKKVFLMQENTTVELDLQNNGKSPAKLWISTCVVRKVKLNGNGDILGKLTSGCLEEEVNETAPTQLTIPKLSVECRTLESSLKSLKPSAECPQVSISYVLRVKILIEKTLRLGKAKPKHIDFPIAIGWSPRTTPMRRTSSRVSIGKTMGSRQRSTTSSVSPVRDCYYAESPPPYSVY